MICHDLTLQIISYQIKDNMRNHGSIGHLGSWILAGILALRVSAFSFIHVFQFMVSLLLLFFLLVTILSIIQTLFGPTTFLYICLLLSSDLWSGIFLFLFLLLSSNLWSGIFSFYQKRKIFIIYCAINHFQLIINYSYLLSVPSFVYFWRLMNVTVSYFERWWLQIETV